MLFTDPELKIISALTEVHKNSVVDGIQEDILNFKKESNYDYLIHDLKMRITQFEEMESIREKISIELQKRKETGNEIPF